MNTSSVCRRARLLDVVLGLLGLLLCGSLCRARLAPREALAQELLQTAASRTATLVPEGRRAGTRAGERAW